MFMKADKGRNLSDEIEINFLCSVYMYIPVKLSLELSRKVFELRLIFSDYLKCFKCRYIMYMSLSCYRFSVVFVHHLDQL